MSTVARFYPESLTGAQYDEVHQRLEEAGQWPPDGLEYHVCSGSEGQLTVSEIWSSREQFEAFGVHLQPILDEVGIKLSQDPVFLDVYNQERF
jgi:hypothetical protein